jgi:hypothetical protein
MNARKTKLGSDHPDTLTSMANLASTYRNQGRWDEAEKLEVDVMNARKTKLGSDHPDTLTSMANLASHTGIREGWMKHILCYLMLYRQCRESWGPATQLFFIRLKNLTSFPKHSSINNQQNVPLVCFHVVFNIVLDPSFVTAQQCTRPVRC